MTKLQTCKECRGSFVGPDSNIGDNVCSTCDDPIHAECKAELADLEAENTRLREDQQWMHKLIGDLCSLFPGKVVQELPTEIKRLRLKARIHDRLPFCPDHRDKVAGLPCRECKIEELKDTIMRMRRRLQSLDHGVCD